MKDKKDNTIQLINGDCLEVMKGMSKDSVDLFLSDIPYGKVNRKSNGLRNLDKKSADELTFDLGEFINELARATRGSVYVFCGTEQVSQIRGELVNLGFSTRLCI